MNKRKNNKIIVDLYEQPIFVPNKLYVVKNYSKEDIDKLFEDAEEKSIWYEGDYKALTHSNICEKGHTEYVIAVLLSDELLKDIEIGKIKDAINVVAHEAYHVAYRILSYCGINATEDTNETFAFVVGWATECIYSTLMKKEKR